MYARHVFISGQQVLGAQHGNNDTSLPTKTFAKLKGYAEITVRIDEATMKPKNTFPPAEFTSDTLLLTLGGKKLFPDGKGSPLRLRLQLWSELKPFVR
jgi:hypothetical protein